MAKKSKVVKRNPKRPPPGVPIHPNIVKNMVQEPMILEAIKWLKEGLSYALVRELIIANKKRGVATLQVADSIIAEAGRRLRVEFAKERQHIFALHTRRYDRDIRRLINIDVTRYDEDVQQSMKTEAFMTALDVMLQKEKLLQIHTKGFQVRINNKINTKVKEKKINFDLSKLTLDEKIDFLRLIQKSKKTNDELHSVILNTNKKQVAEDIEYEEVVQEVPQLELYRPEVEKEVVVPGKTLLNVQQKLADTLKRKAEEEFKRKGGKV